MRLLIEEIIHQDDRLEVVASYDNAEEAIENVGRVRPDVISMDIMLPGMDGLEATTEILCEWPTPIVIISSAANSDEVGTSMAALKRGALAVLGKPGMPDSPEFEREARRMTSQLYHMSRVKVLRQFARRQKARHATEKIAVASPLPPKVSIPKVRCELVAIGASTGGPPALETLFNGLHADFSIPVLLVQHIAPGFTEGLVEWLNSVTRFQFVLGADGLAVRAGYIYVAPDHHQMTVERGEIRLTRRGEPSKHCPSVDTLFSSVARAYGERAVGLLLTGMGADGAQGMLDMRMRRAWTATQSEESCVVYGMPRAAVQLGASSEQLTPAEMAEILNQLNDERKHGHS